MSYKTKPEVENRPLQQGLTKLKKFSTLKRIYRSSGGKRNLRETRQKKEGLQSWREPNSLD